MCHAAVVTNTHDDTAGLQVIQSRNATDEAGNQTAFFTLALASELVVSATITPHTSDARERAFGRSTGWLCRRWSSVAWTSTCGD